MNPLLKAAGRLIPSVRLLHDARNTLLDERESCNRARVGLQFEYDALSQERDALRAERDMLQQSLSDERGKIAPILLAQDESRLIITDYPYYPVARSLQTSAAGKRLVQQFRKGEEDYARLLRNIARHIDRLAGIPREQTQNDPSQPCWNNDWIPAFDGVSIYGLIAHYQPRRYVEIGSGNTTRFARRAIRDLGLLTRIISVDPMPRAEIDAICDEAVRHPLERVGEKFWAEFGSEDLLFVDNSHRSFMNSDVTVFFTDVLPMLPAGSIWGLHDICLPNDYPDTWRDRYYNEQYLLLAYLDGGAGADEILLPLAWVSSQPQLHDIFAPLWRREDLLHGVGRHGAAFWMRRKPNDDEEVAPLGPLRDAG